MPAKRPRMDFMPGKAGLQALAELRAIRPDLNRQAVVDYALITALSALRYVQRQGAWAPPVLFGRNRDVWRVPAECRDDQAVPSSSAPNAQGAPRVGTPTERP
jgi:hypothetical protein